EEEFLQGVVIDPHSRDEGLLPAALEAGGRGVTQAPKPLQGPDSQGDHLGNVAQAGGVNDVPLLPALAGVVAHTDEIERRHPRPTEQLKRSGNIEQVKVVSQAVARPCRDDTQALALQIHAVDDLGDGPIAAHGNAAVKPPAEPGYLAGVLRTAGPGTL